MKARLSPLLLLPVFSPQPLVLGVEAREGRLISGYCPSSHPALSSLTPAGLRRVPEHRTGSGSLSATARSSHLTKQPPQQGDSVVINPLESSLFQQHPLPSRLQPQFWSQKGPSACPHSQTPETGSHGPVSGRPTLEVQGIAHSLGGTSRAETHSVAFLPWKPPASADTSLVTGRCCLCR